MVIRLILAIVLLAGSGMYAHQLRGARTPIGELPALGELPAEFGSWWSEDIPISDVEVRVLAADTLINRRYRDPAGTVVWLFVAYFKEQSVNSQIHSPRNCLPGAGWRVEFVDTRDVAVGPVTAPVTCMRIANDEHHEDVFYWFRTRSGWIAGEYRLKWDLMMNAIARRPTDALFVRVISSRPESALALMSEIQPPLDRILAEVGL